MDLFAAWLASRLSLLLVEEAEFIDLMADAGYAVLRPSASTSIALSGRAIIYG